MAKYRVHIFVEARVPVDVEADGPEAAAKMADERTDLHSAVEGGGARYSESVLGYLVDTLDAEGHMIDGESVELDRHGKPAAHPQKGSPG